MDEQDRAVMSESIGVCPWMIDSFGISLCHRPRLYWISWEVQPGEGIVIEPIEGNGWYAWGRISLQTHLDPLDFHQDVLY